MDRNYRSLALSLLLATTSTASLADNSVAEPGKRPERLFLQQVSNDSAIVKWRSTIAETSNNICIATTSAGLNTKPQCMDGRETDTRHLEAQFGQLSADTEYFYSVNGYTAPDLRFRTAPEEGQLPADGNIHVWILGDSGTASDIYKGKSKYPGMAESVMKGYKSYNADNGAEPLDLILLLGDNAYPVGSDSDWQIALFDLYTDLLSQSAIWPTIGNHEMGLGIFGKSAWPGGSISTTSDEYLAKPDDSPGRMPYLDIFTLPSKAEIGGVPSGTEQYYSFNYGTVHFVSLDSQLTARDEEQRDAMKQWLLSDLSSNKSLWTVVIYHHPPYTRGSHDSDTEPSLYMAIDTPIISMREEFTPIFEDYGVDLVYGGHSHSYERSYYLHGHRGDAITFDPKKHTELNSAGLPATGFGTESYSQISPSSQKNDKVVYTVTGSAGKVKLGTGKLDHPANAVQQHDPQGRHGLAELGSVVLDIEDKQLTARFVNEKGEVHDTVIIRRQ